MVHLVVAIGLGTQEVGTDALAEAFAAFGLFGLTVEDWVSGRGVSQPAQHVATRVVSSAPR
jgi:hypothetical protein